ncbi:MAG: lipoyl(octanoyl) transferase LipB [Chitinophagales bacterium]
MRSYLVNDNPQEYGAVLRQQEKLFYALIEAKQEKSRANIREDEHCILCVHEPIYTIGKRTVESNFLLNTQSLPAPVYKTNRGGEVTFHGHGQWVGYPIFDLEQHRIGLKHHIERIEEAIIHTLSKYGIKSHRSEKGAGIWVGNAKICAIGVRASRYVTMHGFALNVNTDLSYYDAIVPCGIRNASVTSMQDQLGTEIDMLEVSQWLIHAIDKFYP